MPATCPFCDPDPELVWLSNDCAHVLWDGFPVSKGHTLIVPRQHVASIYELTSEEQASLWATVAQARQRLVEDLHPDGFNIGLNDGVVAGQTIMHAHIHLIPRYAGDVADPRGGVRWVLPEKACYWEPRSG